MTTCPESQIRVGDKNVRFIFTIEEDCVAVDLTDATNYDVIFYKPDGETLTVDATLLTDGTDGKIYYNTVDGDIDQCGMWKLQAVVNFGSSSTYHSKIQTFKVWANLI